MRIRAAAKSATSPEALLALYLDELARHHFSRSAQESARLIVPRFFSHLREEGIKDVRAAREEHVVSFAKNLGALKTQRTGQPLSHASKVHYLNRVKAFLRFLEKRSIILMNPAHAVRLPHVRGNRRVLSERDARRLMDAPLPSGALGLRDRAILETLYGTAIRLSECARLEIADLDLRERTLLVRNGKGKRDRVVPVPGRAADALALYLGEVRGELVRDPLERALFLRCSRGGSGLGAQSMYLLVRSYARAAGIPGRVSPHVLRHTCATHLLRGGASVRHVQQLLGHQRLETTALYTRVVVDDLRGVLERSHPREWARRKHPRP